MLEQERVLLVTPEEQYSDALEKFEHALRAYNTFDLINSYMRVQTRGFFVFKSNNSDYTLYYTTLYELAHRAHTRAKREKDEDVAARFLNWQTFLQKRWID